MIYKNLIERENNRVSCYQDWLNVYKTSVDNPLVKDIITVSMYVLIYRVYLLTGWGNRNGSKCTASIRWQTAVRLIIYLRYYVQWQFHEVEVNITITNQDNWKMYIPHGKIWCMISWIYHDTQIRTLVQFLEQIRNCCRFRRITELNHNDCTVLN